MKIKILIAIASANFLYIASLPILVSIDKSAGGRIFYQRIAIVKRTSDDPGKMQAKVLAPRPWDTIYSPLLKLSVSRNGELNSFGKIVLWRARFGLISIHDDDSFSEVEEEYYEEQRRMSDGT